MEDGKTALGSLSSPMWRLGWPHLFPEPARSPLFKLGELVEASDTLVFQRNQRLCNHWLS